MRVREVALELAILAAVLLAVRCGDSGRSGNSTNLLPSTDSTASQLRQAAVAAMNGLQSYRAELDFGSSPPYIEEFQRPANYHSLLGEKDADTGASKGVGEVLYVGDTIFGRHCDGRDELRGVGATTARPGGRRRALAIVLSSMARGGA